MDQQQFDRIIREQLQELRPDFRPELWDRMEQALDAEDAHTEWLASDEVFDSTIKNKLESLQGANAAKHWPLLLRRLEIAPKIDFQVISLKLSEVFLLLLMLLTAVQFEHKFNPYQNTNPAWWLPGSSTTPQANLPLPPSVKQRNTTASTALHSATTKAKNSETATTLLEKNQAASGLAGGGVLSAETTEHRNNVAEKREHLTEVSTLVANTILLDTKAAEIEHPAPPTASIFEDLNSKKESHKPFEPSPLINFRSPKFSPKTNESELAGMIRPERKRLSLHVGMFGGPDYNRIISPPNPELRNQRDDYYALGYGGGINVALEYGRWELGSGLTYSAKQYDPRQVGFITGSLQQGYNGEVLREIQLNIFSIPLNARYNFIHNDRWRSYFVVGSALQVATDATYFITSLHLPNATTAPLPEPNSSQINNTPQGFLQGGSLRQNGFVTANFGLGIERIVSNRISLFVQPTYQHSIGYFSGGFGPDRDRINTMSIWMGVRVKVKR